MLPIAPRTKTPALRGGHGVKDASLDPEQLECWWTAMPNAGVAIACGSASGGLVVVDVDPRNDGIRTMDGLVQAHGRLPRTPRVVTGGGGEHRYFRLPSLAPPEGVPSSLGPGVDVKGEGGYVVAPPSVHASGVRYAWDLAALPSETAVALLPPWVLASPRRPTAVPVLRPLARGAAGAAPPSFLQAAFVAAGWAGHALPDGKLAVRCPWLDLHSVEPDGARRGDGRDSSAVVLPPATATAIGSFCCLHAHCAGRSHGDLLRALPPHALEHASRMHPRAYGALLRRLLRRGEGP